MNINKLISTHTTPYLIANNDDAVEFKFRIEVWLKVASNEYFATISHGFLCDLYPTSLNGTMATEDVWTTDDLLSEPDSAFTNEQDALADALRIIENEYHDIPDEEP